MPWVSLLVVSVLGCNAMPAWEASGAPARAPDDQYRVGAEDGYDVYVWDCYKGEHLVVAQQSSALRSEAATTERGPCGGATPLEVRLASAAHLKTAAPWPGSAARPPRRVLLRNAPTALDSGRL